MGILEYKHKPIPILLDRDPVLTRSIQSKLANEILELTEFKTSFQDILTGFTTSLKKDIDDYSLILNTSFMQTYQDTLTQLQTAVSCLLAQDVPNMILDLFAACTSPEDIKNTTIIRKSLTLPMLSIREDLKTSISYDITLVSDQFDPVKAKRHSHAHHSTFHENTFNPSPMTLRTGSVSVPSSPNKFRVLGFSRPINETIYYVEPFSSRVSFYNIKEETFNEFTIDSARFPNKAAWSLSKDGRLILSGGFNEAAKREAYAISVNERRCETLPSMITRRFNHAQVTVDSSIFVFGGMDKKPLSECEYYSTEKKRWNKYGSLVVSREHPSACHFLGKLYVAGGNGIESLECSQIAREKFELLSLRLPGPGRCNMFVVANQILILHRGIYISITLPNMVYKQIGDIEQNSYWTCSEKVIFDKKIYWVSDGNFIVFDVETGEFKKLT